MNRLEEHKVIATAYFAENTRMMSEMAAALGDTAKAAEWAALVPQIRAAFVSAYRSADGSIYTGTQTAYALALGMDMIADPAQRAQTADRFVAKLAADGNHLKTGFLGTPWLLPALSKIGREDLAMRLLLNEDYPSWGFPISMGATTMWERWNSVQPNGDFGPVDMNSFNHYAYGAVGDWMFAKLGGLLAVEPGYKTALIAPLIGHSGLTRAACAQETPYGRLATEWTVSPGAATLTVEIPVNTTATIHLPGTDGTGVMEGSTPAADAPGVRFLRVENGAALYEVGSGAYAFSWALAQETPPLIGDAGFETPATATFVYNPSGGAWTFTAQSGNSGSGVATNGSLFTSANANAPEGTQVAFLQGTGVVSQLLTDLVPGVTYHLFFAAAQRTTWNVNGQTWNLTVDGATAASFAPDQTATAYENYGASFTATATTHQIAFVGTNTRGGDNTVFLDQVRLVAGSPPAPAELTAAFGHKQVWLEWSAVGGATGYVITRSTADGADTIFTVDAAQTTFLDSDLTNGVAYSYRLTTVNETGAGLPSLAVTATPLAPPVSEAERVAPRIALDPDANLVVITVVASVPGHFYTLQFRDDLAAGEWQAVADVGVQEGTGADLEFIASFDTNRRFFRILIET